MIFLPENEIELRTTVQMFKHMNNNRDPFARINAVKWYLDKWNIKDVVVGISGGVDSSLVLAMLAKIPGITIHAITLSFDQYHGVFNPNYVTELRRAFQQKNIIWRNHDLEKSFDAFMHDIEIDEKASVDANVSYSMRYLALFAYAQDKGGVTFGTTNFDEMGYAGWFGKTSDMMVDIQPIADLHKFEVVSWARILGVPEVICNRTPTGDLIDGTSDEENFSCSYDELSWFTDLMTKQLKPGSKIPNEFLSKRFEKLIALHGRNAHKYQGQKFNPVFL